MTIGATLALEAVAAVVLGGTAVTGGRISLLGTAFGVILLRLLQNGLLLAGAPSLWQPVVTGLVLLLVLGAEALSGRLPLERLLPSAVGGAGANRSAMTPRVSAILTILGFLWVVVVVGLAILKPAAIALSTVTAVLQFSTILALVALGQTLVILCGGAGIDISVGGMVSLAVVLAMILVKVGLPGVLLPVLCLILGLLLGLVNGFLVTRLRLLPLIATLATFYVYSGAAVALTGGAAQAGVPGFLLPWGRGAIGGLPLPFLTLALPLFVLAGVLLHMTSWGRWIYGMGFNERSARLVGVPVDRVRLAAYGASGALAGCAALVSVAWLGGGRPNIGQNLELTSLTAAMLGGVGIFGGRGGVFGVLAAVLLLVTLQTGLLQLNVNTVWQVGIVGTILVIVLMIDRLALIRRTS
jgi:ribose transport system permease protein